MNRRHDEIVNKAIGLVAMRDLLDEPCWWTKEGLAERLGRSVRTVERWLYDMDAIGCAVEFRELHEGKTGRSRMLLRGMRR